MATTSTQPNYTDEHPLKDIPHPHPHDVLCGRGGGTNNHIGNSHWRMLVAANKQLYITLPKRQKMLLSRSIVNAVRSQNPPGRFLQKDSKSNKWFDVGDQRAQEKTSQALREGAPDIRKKVAAGTDDVDATDDTTENPGDEQEEPIDTTPIPVTSNGGSTTSTSATTKTAATANSQSSPAPQPTPGQAAAAAAAAAGIEPAQQQPHHHPHHPPPPVPTHSHAFPHAVSNGSNGGAPGGMPPMHNGYPMHPSPYYYAPQMGMPPPHMQQQQPQHMSGYPPMVMHEHGMMAPSHYMQHHHPHPYHHPQQQPQQHMMQQQQQQPHGMQQQHPQHGMYPPQPHAPPHPLHNDDPLPYNSSDGNEAVHFDEYISPPDAGLESSKFSFGSVVMSDVEQKNLERGGHSFGTAMSVRKDGGGGAMVEPTGALESAPGASFGDVSMMSVGTRKLEDAGFSFGSQMSYKADMPDGGLEGIGASFGSLSLDTTNRQTLFQQLEIAAGGAEIPPMLNSTKSTGNLLECSDSESEEDESQKHDIARRKSQAWEKMQASVANNLSSTKSKSTAGSGELMPPPPAVAADKTGTDISVPTTRFDRDFSQLSAYDDGDNDFNHDGNDEDALPPPPSQLEKQGDEDEKLELFLIQKQADS